jgi:hypothetical protein
MPKIKLPDLSNVEDVGQFNDMPKGLYVFKIRETSEAETGETSKVPGQPMGVVVLDPVRVVGGAKIKSGEYQGLWHRFPLDDANPGWTPRLKEFVQAVPKAVKKDTLDLKLAEGELVIGKVRDGKNNDGDRTAELSSLMRYTADAAGGAEVDDDDVDEDELWTEEDLAELSTTDLKDAAGELEVEVPAGKLTPAKKKKLIDAILEAQEGDEDDEGDGEDEDEDEDEEEWDEESLMAASKDELAEAAGEFEVEFPTRLTAAARKRVVAAILEAQGGDGEDEDEDDEEQYSEEDLAELSLADLKTVATDEFELEVPKGNITIVKKKLIAAILEAQEGGEDEDEDEDEDDDDGYDDMTKTQLAAEVRSRGGKVKKGMTQESMVKWLREQDAEGEEEDEEEDEDEELDPDSMSGEEVKAALAERGISAKGSLKVLRAKLTKALEADDDGDPF